MQLLRLRAPAKINLWLRVLGRRRDGLHELDTLFLPLELADALELRVAPAVENEATRCRCRCPGHPELEREENLATRAAIAYLEAAGLGADVELRLDKRIWIAAGLGGGSSDAAAVLRGLDGLLGPLPAATLRGLAAHLGADVPYFLDPQPARARGIGELLTPVRAMPALELLLLNPGQALPTAAVYEALGLERGTSRPASGGQLPLCSPRTPAAAAALIHNDLDDAARALCPLVDVMKARLLAAGAIGAGVSGSGPSVFGVFADRAAARWAEARLRRTTTFRVLATRSLAPAIG